MTRTTTVTKVTGKKRAFPQEEEKNTPNKKQATSTTPENSPDKSQANSPKKSSNWCASSQI